MGDQEMSGQDVNEGGFSWRLLFSLASFGAALVIALVTLLIFKEVDPPFIVMFLLFLAGGILAFRKGKAGVVGIVLASLGAAMFTAFAGPFAFVVIELPEGPDEFIPVLATLTMALTVLISAIVVAIRGRGRGFLRSTGAGVLGIVALVLVIGITVFSLYSASKVETASARQGDELLTTEDFEFKPDQLKLDSGTVALHITNKDDATHTFTIDELDVDQVIPAGKSVRVKLNATSGKYRFYCRPHAPDMDGDLAVS